MSENNKSSKPKDEFIDLDKDQYKKKSNLKRNIFFISILLVTIFFIIIKLDKSDLFDFLVIKDNTTLLNQEEQLKETPFQNNEDYVKTNEFKDIHYRLNKLNEEIVDNKVKLSRAESIIKGLKKEIKIIESQRLNNENFLNTEKYVILNVLLSLKNKFKKREDINRELESLILRFNNKPDIKTLIIYLQDIEISKVTRLEFLLENLNSKISLYERDINSFIEINSRKELKESERILESRENFISYIKQLLGSIFKITKLKGDSNVLQDNADQERFVSLLKQAKEYLLLGNKKRAVKILMDTNFDDYEINNWVNEANILVRTEEKIEILESKLLDYIGENID